MAEEEDQLGNWRSGAGAGDGEGCSGGVELALGLRTGSGGAAAEAPARRKKKSMTIFYGGRVCTVDVTDLQARAIISMANQEMMILAEQRRRHMDGDRHQDSAGPRSPPPAPRRDDHQDCLEAAAPGLSMKRSLQRFLQKRKARAAAAGERPRNPAMPS